MPEAPRPDRYGAVAQALHWIMALLIGAMLVVGIYMLRLPQAEKFPGKIGYDLYQLHKSVGLVVLVLAVLRIGWRLTHRAPRLPATLKPYEKGLAHASHLALYLLILAMPLSGWLMVSASELAHGMLPTRFFDLFTVPNLLAADEAAEATLGQVHTVLAFAAIAVLVLHVGAALKHHFVLKDNVLLRMLPFTRLRSTPGD